MIYSSLLMDSVNFREKTGLLLLGRKRHNVCNKNIIIQLIRPVIYAIHIRRCLNKTEASNVAEVGNEATQKRHFDKTAQSGRVLRPENHVITQIHNRSAERSSAEMLIESMSLSELQQQVTHKHDEEGGTSIKRLRLWTEWSHPSHSWNLFSLSGVMADHVINTGLKFPDFTTT